MEGVLLALLRGVGVVSVVVAVDRKIVVVLAVTEVVCVYTEDVLEDGVENGWLVNELCRVKFKDTVAPVLAVRDSAAEELVKTKLVDVWVVVLTDIVLLTLVSVLRDVDVMTKVLVVGSNVEFG